MTPKERARELVDNFSNVPLLDSYEAKQCALIAVDIVLNLCWGNNQVGINHWNEVKQEIEKL